jgi:hypothetical protein
MGTQVSPPHDPYLVLFSSTHVMFLDTHEQRRAEAFKKKNVYLLNGRIEPVERLPSGIQLGKVYRHYAPLEKNPLPD